MGRKKQDVPQMWVDMYPDDLEKARKMYQRHLGRLRQRKFKELKKQADGDQIGITQYDKSIFK